MSSPMKTYITPRIRTFSVRSGSLLDESLPVHEEPESPHVTDDSQVFAKPHSVWDEEE